MQLSDRELWLLNFYRNSELHGALLMGRLARSVSDPELIVNFTRHCATEAHHATLLSDLLQSLGASFQSTITVQEAYAEQGGVPKQIADLLVVSEVLEKRVLKTYTAHLTEIDFPEPVQRVLRKIVHEMEEEEDGEHAGWIDRRLQLLPHNEVEAAEEKWRAIDEKVEAGLSAQLETNYPSTEITK